MRGWMAWHQQRTADRETLRFHAARAQGTKKRRMMVAWRNFSVRRRMDMQVGREKGGKWGGDQGSPGY